jgi:cellulose biosynthesis protein BcsQ
VNNIRERLKKLEKKNKFNLKSPLKGTAFVIKGDTTEELRESVKKEFERLGMNWDYIVINCPPDLENTAWQVFCELLDQYEGGKQK